MSLGSRELFHSNFLAWLFENNPEVIEIIFGVSCSGSAGLKVLRESQQIDIVVEIQDGSEPGKLGTVLAIENKVKDTPNASQLRKYSEKLSQKYDGQAGRIEKYVLSLEPDSKVHET